MGPRTRQGPGSQVTPRPSSCATSPRDTFVKIRHNMSKDPSVSENIVSQEMNKDFNFDHAIFPPLCDPDSTQSRNMVEEGEGFATTSGSARHGQQRALGHCFQ